MTQPDLGFIPLAKHESAVKFLPSYIGRSPSGSVSDRQLETLCVGSTELAASCSQLVVFQHPHMILKGISQSPPFPIHYGTFIQYFLFTCLYNLHPLAVAASSHLVKDLSFISFKPISYQLHWVPHSSNILPFGKQLFISFIKSWRQWINLYNILELSACPTDFKLWTCSLSGLSMQASCSLPRLDLVTLV